MEKDKEFPSERLRMTIEYAENGIIIRRHDYGGVEVVVTKKELEGVGDMYENEYKAIGKHIYGWLDDCVIAEHQDELIIGAMELDITATCKGEEAED